MVPAVHVLIY